MNIPETTTPVLVLTAENYGGLGIMRSLGRFGIPVYGVDSSTRSLCFSSRYCHGKFTWDFDSASASDSVQFLLEVGRKIGQKTVLFNTSDHMASFVADHVDALKEWFYFPGQSAELIHRLCSKKDMFHIAKECDVPTADTLYPTSREDVAQFIQKTGLPIIIKGNDGILLEQQTGKRMLIVHTEKELYDFYDSLNEAALSNIVLQEYIPGADNTIWIFNGYFNEQSDCLVAFTGKKVRQFPVYKGMTSLGICLGNETVRQTTTSFMKAIGYRGILDIGYRYDARDGLYKVLDINPRIGMSFRLFIGDNGMDVARALYLDLTGQPVPQTVLREGRKWIVEDKDIVSCYHYFRDGKLSFWDWVRSFGGIQEGAYFALDDLVPLMIRFKRLVLKAGS